MYLDTILALLGCRGGRLPGVLPFMFQPMCQSVERDVCGGCDGKYAAGYLIESIDSSGLDYSKCRTGIPGGIYGADPTQCLGGINCNITSASSPTQFQTDLANDITSGWLVYAGTQSYLVASCSGGAITLVAPGFGSTPSPGPISVFPAKMVPCYLIMSVTGVVSDNAVTRADGKFEYGDWQYVTPENERDDNTGSGAMVMMLSGPAGVGSAIGSPYGGLKWSGSACGLEFAIEVTCEPYEGGGPLEPPGWYITITANLTGYSSSAWISWRMPIPGSSGASFDPDDPLASWPNLFQDWTFSEAASTIHQKQEEARQVDIEWLEEQYPAMECTLPPCLAESYNPTSRAARIRPVAVQHYNLCCEHSPVCPAEVPAVETTSPVNAVGVCCATVTFAGIEAKASPVMAMGPVNTTAAAMNGKSVHYRYRWCDWVAPECYCIQPMPWELGITTDYGGSLPVTTVSVSGMSAYYDDNGMTEVESVTLSKSVEWSAKYMKPSRADFLNGAGQIVLAWDESESTPVAGCRAADWSGATATVAWSDTEWGECQNAYHDCDFGVAGWVFEFTPTAQPYAEPTYGGRFAIVDGPELGVVNQAYTVYLSRALWWFRGLMGIAADNTATTCKIYWGDTTSTTVPPAIRRVNHTYTSAGSYNIYAEVTTAAGVLTTNTIPLTITAAPTPNPIVTATGESYVAVGGTYTLSISSVSGLDNLKALMIDWGDGSDDEIYSGTPPSLPHDFQHQYTGTVVGRGYVPAIRVKLRADHDDDGTDETYEYRPGKEEDPLVWPIVVDHPQSITFHRLAQPNRWATDDYWLQATVLGGTGTRDNSCTLALWCDTCQLTDKYGNLTGLRYSWCIPSTMEVCGATFEGTIIDGWEFCGFQYNTTIRMTPICPEE